MIFFSKFNLVNMRIRFHVHYICFLSDITLWSLKFCQISASSKLCFNSHQPDFQRQAGFCNFDWLEPKCHRHLKVRYAKIITKTALKPSPKPGKANKKWKRKNEEEERTWSFRRWNIITLWLSVTNYSPSQDSSHPDDLFQSRYVNPGFKPFSYCENCYFQRKPK